MHYLREIGGFAARTQMDNIISEIIDVEPREAEWCLEAIDRLFGYYPTGPAEDRETRPLFDKKLNSAGRKPINPIQVDE